MVGAPRAADPGVPISADMVRQVELATAPNGAIANKCILNGIEKVAWLEPTIEQPAEGIWVSGGYGRAPIAIIDTDDGLIAFDFDQVGGRLRSQAILD
jgi:hypothetical protein